MDLIGKYLEEFEAIIDGPLDEGTVDGLLSKYQVRDSFYRSWLIQTGGGPVGPDWLDGADELEASQAKFARESWALKGFVIGWDGSGNPIVITLSGTVETEDHTFGGVNRLAGSFSELLAKCVSS